MNLTFLSKWQVFSGKIPASSELCDWSFSSSVNITFRWRNISKACRAISWNFRWFRDKLSDGNQSAKLITIFCVKKWPGSGGLTKNFIYSKTDYSIMLRLWNTMVVYSAESKVFFKQLSEWGKNDELSEKFSSFTTTIDW